MYAKILNLRSLVARIWPVIKLAVYTLLGVECLGYLAGSLMHETGGMFFVSAILISLLGFLICHRHGKDVGRTMAQLYLLDVGLHLVALAAFLFLLRGTFFDVFFFVLQAISIGLTFCRVLAVSAMLSLPNQPSWPNLIWFMKLKQDAPRTELHDTLIWTAIALFMILGAVIAYFCAGIEILVVFFLACILIFVLRSELHYVETKAAALPIDLVHLAGIVDKIKNPEDRAYMIEIATASLGKVSQSMVESRMQTDAEAAMAASDNSKR
jgi:hypothetical protein